MLILRIRHAETALADGRLDEAFELLREAKLRSHRRGQNLVTKLTAALTKRGREHLAAKRFSAALTDCEKAQQLAGDQPDLVALRSEAMDAANDARRQERLKHNAVAAARDEIENGHLSSGERLLAVASVRDTRAGQLLQELGQRHDVVDSAVRNAGDAIDRDDIDAALAEIERAKHADRSDKRIKELCDRLKHALHEQLTAAINEGRLDRADSLGQRLMRIDEQGVESQQLLAAVAQCKAAWERIDHGRVRDAAEICRRMIAVFPKAKWINETCKHLEHASEAIESLRTGPLGLLSTTPVMRHDSPTTVPGTTGYQPVPATSHGLVARDTGKPSEFFPLPSKFIVQIDGAGSALVLRQPTVTIGPVSSDRIPDVGLIMEPGSPLATIERADEDYFLRGSVLAVNDRPAANKLLVGGDRIALSPRCRIGFVLPSAASTTAVLDMIGARYPRSDVRRIVLMDREMVIGPGMTAHMRCDTTPEPIVLHVRDNRLFCRTTAGVEVNGKPMDRERGIPLGAHVRVGLVSFVVTKA